MKGPDWLMTSKLFLNGQTILVTGASRSIGAATTRVLAAIGACVITHYARDKITATAILDDIGRRGYQREATRQKRMPGIRNSGGNTHVQVTCFQRVSKAAR
jgi:NAD(P)-dependent dehydrogenase (short-subunit alcohol dehydrogenase family)